MEGSLGNATPITAWHQSDWWKSPRWIVIRIEALAVVAIIFSFFLAAFGSCRRWSNSWIVQKGFFAAQVLSLSLGTYSIGLMQSSSVKSEMYPIWTVSLFTLFGCIDPVTTYNGLDYKGPLSKVVYGICLNCGYVLLMSISTISNVVGNAAIITLSAITFVKGFHRSFALVQQNRMLNMAHDSPEGIAYIMRKEEDPLISYDKGGGMVVDDDTDVRLDDIEASIRNNKDERLQSCYDVCIALCLSHKLQRYFVGLDYRVARPETLRGINFKWALKVIEIELAFVYDALFTGNPFLHYYQAKTASLWALASFTGICFVLVAAAIPGGMSSRPPSASGGCTKVVGTTTADLAITFGILMSLALLQLTELVRSWTSNWARAAVAGAYATKDKGRNTWAVRLGDARIGYKLSGWMRLKVFVATSTNLFDRNLWQDKISQYSMLPEPRLLTGWKREDVLYSNTIVDRIRWRCVHLVQMLGLHYIWQVIWELLSSDTNKRGGVKLDEDVKGSVIDFLGQIQTDRLDRIWLLSLPEEPEIRYFLPYFDDPQLHASKPEALCERYTSCVMTWHIVTWYCELVEEQTKAEMHSFQKSRGQKQTRGGGGGTKTRDHRRVANALSMYCVYLVKSAPELLPGPVPCMKRVYDRFKYEAKGSRVIEVPFKKRIIEVCDKDTILANMPDNMNWAGMCPETGIWNGQAVAKLLLMRGRDEMWKTLELVWVQLLVYAAPYGNAEAHMRHLSQGGEFITHLWALFYQLDIREWKVQGNLAEITTREDAERVLAEDDLAVVALLFGKAVQNTYQDEVATVSRLVDGVRYYYTSDLNVFEIFGIEYKKLLDIYGRELKNPQDQVVFLKKEANNHKFTLYKGDFRAHDIARFVIENKIALAHDQAQAQSSEDHGGQSEAGIEEEIQPLP